MEVRDDVILPDLEVVKGSLRVMKAQAHLLRTSMASAAGVYLPNGYLRYKNDHHYDKRVAIARKVIKLEKIIAQMELIRLAIMTKKLMEAA